MPVSKGRVGNHEVTVLRDSGCSGVIVREDLIAKEQFNGDSKWTLMADSKCVRAPVAKIHVNTPFYVGEVEAVCLKKPLYDLMIGNIDGARRPDDPDPEWSPASTQRVEVVEEDPLPFPDGDLTELLRDNVVTPAQPCRPEIVGAVTTRAQAKRDKTSTPLKVADNSKAAIVDRDKLIQLQEADSTLNKYRNRQDHVTKGSGTVYFEVKAKILYRIFQHPRVNGGKPLRQVLVP
ncbi:hypothetical protein, partial [Acinetobacter baumannii]|uniref:hypothetical protein n=1 Tax=Acinetobacter baumannii TaxID=470 RepID=UPI003393709E